MIRISERELRLLVREQLLREVDVDDDDDTDADYDSSSDSDTGGPSHLDATSGRSIAIICYTNSDFFGKGVAALLSKVGVDVQRDPESGNPSGWITNYIPQGHAWILLVNPANGDVIKCNFGSRSCDVTGLESTLEAISIALGKKGIPILAANKIEITVEGRLTQIADGNVSLPELKRIMNAGSHTIEEYLIVKGVNYRAARRKAGTNGECKPYNLMPVNTSLINRLGQFGLPASWLEKIKAWSVEWENCGSYTLEVLGAGLGNLPGPDDLIQAAMLPGAMIQVAKKFIPEGDILV